MKKLISLTAMLLITTTLMATESRVGTMGGDINLLLNDEQNIFTYPSTALNFKQLATLEFGTLPSWGMGIYPAGMISIGDDETKIVLLGNRPIYSNNHPRNQMTLHAYGIDIAKQLGNLNLGFMLNLATRQENTSNGDTSFTYNTLFLGIIPGFSFRSGSMGLDMAFNLTLQNWKDEGEGVSTADTFKFAGSPFIEIDTRFYTGSRRRKIIGAFSFNYFKDAYEHNGAKFNNGNQLNINAELGTCIKPIRSSKLIGGFNFHFNNTSTSDTSGVTTINAGFVLGGEGLISSKFGLRAGINRNLFFYTKNKNGSRSNSLLRFADDPINVSLGAFIKLRNVRFDARIAHDLLFNGPYFITGTPSTLATTVSAIVYF